MPRKYVRKTNRRSREERNLSVRAEHRDTPDLDKLLRSTGDALTTSGLIADDARIVAITAEKVETTGWCGAEVHIGPARAYPEVGE